MSNQIRVGHWKSDSNDVHIPVGFVPDYVKICEVGETNPIRYEWFERQEDDEAAGSREGNLLPGSSGTILQNSDGAGITAYDTGSVSPASGTGAGQLSEWSTTTSYAAKTAVARGSFVKATVGALNNLGQIVDREAIFENVGTTGNSDGSNEPVWPSAVGDTVVDASNPIWELVVDVPVKRVGYQGFSVSSTIQQSDREYYYLALKAGDSINHGDVAEWSSGVDQNWS